MSFEAVRRRDDGARSTGAPPTPSRARDGAPAGMPLYLRSRLQRPSGPSQAKAGCSCGGDCPTCAADKLIPGSGTQARAAMPGARSADPAERQADEIGNRIGADLAGAGPIQSGPLSGAARAVGERHLGVSLEGARILGGDEGHQRASGERALAVARGDEVAFRHGHLDAGTAAGRALIGHELTHVAQQRAHPASSPAVQRFSGDITSMSIDEPMARAMNDRELAEQIETLDRYLARSGLPEADAAGSRANRRLLIAERDRRAAESAGVSTPAASSMPQVARPPGLPLDGGFSLQPLSDFPSSLLGQIPDGQITDVPIGAVVAAMASTGAGPGAALGGGGRDRTGQLLEAPGFGYLGARVPTNAALMRVGFNAAGEYAVGLVAIPTMQLNPFGRYPHGWDPAAPLDTWGHTAMYVRQNGQITVVRGFNPVMTALRPGNVGSVGTGASGVPGSISSDAYLFTSTNARTLEYTVTREIADRLAGSGPGALPGVGPTAGMPGQPPIYAANPVNYVTANPGAAPPGCVGSNCGLWAINQVEPAIGGPVGRVGQGPVSAIGSEGAITPGRAAQGQVMSLMEEGLAASRAGRPSPIAGAPTPGAMPTSLRVLKIGGRVFLVASIVMAGYEIYTARPGETGRTVAGVLGGFAGGFALGATAGLFCGPGAPVCSVVAGLVLGTIGSIVGREVMEQLYDSIDLSFTTGPRPGPNARPVLPSDDLSDFNRPAACPGSCHQPAPERGGMFGGLPPRSIQLSPADIAAMSAWLRSNGPVAAR